MRRCRLSSDSVKRLGLANLVNELTVVGLLRRRAANSVNTQDLHEQLEPDTFLHSATEELLYCTVKARQQVLQGEIEPQHDDSAVP